MITKMTTSPNSLSRKFDRLVLGGYSPGRAQQVNPTDIVDLEGGGRSIYQELLAQLASLRGREEFLYRLRRTWLKAGDYVDMLRDRVSRGNKLTDMVPALAFDSGRLRQVQETYLALESVVAHLAVQARYK